MLSLHCTVLYYTVLYCIVCFCSILCLLLCDEHIYICTLLSSIDLADFSKEFFHILLSCYVSCNAILFCYILLYCTVCYFIFRVVKYFFCVNVCFCRYTSYNVFTLIVYIFVLLLYITFLILSYDILYFISVINWYMMYVIFYTFDAICLEFYLNIYYINSLFHISLIGRYIYIFFAVVFYIFCVVFVLY